ncbi:putative [Myosin heavy-chain] kinase transcription factor WD40-like family [Dioscorea sansibarensis]
MEFHGSKTWDLLEEDQRISSPARHSCPSFQPSTGHEPRLSFSRHSVSSPGGSPWKKLHSIPRSPSPSILYLCLASLESQAGNVLSIAIARGIVYTGSESERLRVWKQPDCTDQGYIKTGHGEIRAILACGSTVFTSHKDHRVRVWSVTVTDRLRAKKLATLPQRHSFLSLQRRRRGNQLHKDCISCIACNYVEGILYTGSWDGMVKVWRLVKRECVDSFVAHEERVNAMAVNQEDGCLFTGGSDGVVKVWRRVFGDSSHALVGMMRFEGTVVNAVVVSEGSRRRWWVYAGRGDGCVSVMEKEEVGGRYKKGGVLKGHRYGVLCLGVVERLVFSGSEDTTIRVWRRDGEGGHECVAVMEGHRGPVRSLVARVEVVEEVIGVLVYSASMDRVMKVWRVKVMVREREEEEEECGVAESPVLSPLWVERKLLRGVSY